MPLPSFITKAKPKSDGTFWACKKCQRVPQASQDLYMQNIGDDQNKNWIACIDLDCFISQGGTKPAPKQEGGRKKWTPEELFNYRKTLSDLTWEYANKKASDMIPIPVAPNATPTNAPDQKYLNDYNLAVKERRIMASVFYYGIMGQGS